MSRKYYMVLVVGILFFTIGFTPLQIINTELPTQSFSTITNDDVRITYEVTMKPNSPRNPVAILVHGYSGNRKTMKLIALSLADSGIISVSVDLRGHGDSEGSMTFSSPFENDIVAVIQDLKERGIGDTSKLVFVGHSMGGRVAIEFGSKTDSVIATIGIAPAITPEIITITTPKNLLFIISAGDTVIQNNEVINSFNKSINSTGKPGIVYDVGSKRMLLIDNDSNHLTILYQTVVIQMIVHWITEIVFEAKQPLTTNPSLINFSAYLSVIGIVILIGTILAILYETLGTRKLQEDLSCEINWKILGQEGGQAIILAGIGGSLLTAIIILGLMAFSPLLFTNFIVAAFLGNSIVLGYLAKRKMKAANHEFSYSQLFKHILKQRPRYKEIGLGMAGALILLVVIYITIGNYLTLTFSTATLRLLYLPLYTFIYVFIFFFYETFKHAMEPFMGIGQKRMALSPIYMLLIIISSVLIQVLILVTILQQSLGLFLIGLNMLLIFIALAILAAEFFYKTTSGWITQILVNAVLFATTTIVSSPITQLF